MTDPEIVVIGAGMLGLAAARNLAEAGRHVAVIEARNRVGGRIFTANPGADAVELGAEFVHGKPPELWDLLNEAQIETMELKGSHICWRDGRLSACGPLLEREFQWLEALKQWQGNDCSFADYLNRISVPEAARHRLIDYVEGFNAADHRAIGVIALGKQQAAEDAVEGDRLFHVVGGYHQVPEFLSQSLILAGGELILNAQVVAVDWAPGEVHIGFEREGQRAEIRASKAIITLPLAVLLTGAVVFKPHPVQVLEAAARLRMGSVQRTILQFREPFWRNCRGDLSFLYSTGNTPSVWWTPLPDNHAWLTAWTGGPRAYLLPQSQFELERYLLSELSRLFGQDQTSIRKLFLGSFTHDWQRDCRALGAYCYAPVNAENASETTSAPVDRTLYFAGEHTDLSGHWGTVHGAIRSGLRAASQVLNA